MLGSGAVYGSAIERVGAPAVETTPAEPLRSPAMAGSAGARRDLVDLLDDAVEADLECGLNSAASSSKGGSSSLTADECDVCR
jgi:hypothetical protein